MDDFRNPEEKIMCPYNSAHYVLKSRMSGHLVKCKKNYPDCKLVECDFNVNHKVPEPELQYHHENCVDRKNIEITVYQEEGSVINRFPVRHIEVPTEESWDNQNVKSYDAKEYCEKNQIIRHVDVQPPSVRKGFKRSERKKFSALPGPSASADTDLSANNLPQERTPNSAATSRRELPETQRYDLHERAPDEVTELLEHIRIGSRTAFIPKKK